MPIQDIRSEADFPSFADHEIIIDALFGSGLNRAITGLAAELIEYLNRQQTIRIAIDIASGLFADSPSPKGSYQQEMYIYSSGI